MNDEYHPEFGEDSSDHFEETFDEGVEDFFDATGKDNWWEGSDLWDDGEDDDEDDLPLDGADFGAQTRQQRRLARQQAYMDPAAVAARQQRGAEASQALQAGAGIFQMFTPLIQAGAQQAAADREAKRQQRRPRRPAPRRPAPPPPRQMGPPMAYPMAAPPRPPMGPPPQTGGLRDKDKQMMMYMGIGTIAVVALIGGAALIMKK